MPATREGKGRQVNAPWRFVTVTSSLSAHLSGYLLLPNSSVANLLQAAGLPLPNFHLVSRLSSQRIFRSPSKTEIPTAASCKSGVAGSHSRERSRLAKALNRDSGRAAAGLGSAAGGRERRGCRRSGTAPLRAAAAGGPAHPAPALRCRLPRPPPKIRREGMGVGG